MTTEGVKVTLTGSVKKPRKRMQTNPSIPNLHCSFCGKDRKKAGPLVAGPGVHICEACVGLSMRILTDKPTRPGDSLRAPRQFGPS